MKRFRKVSSLWLYATIVLAVFLPGRENGQSQRSAVSLSVGDLVVCRVGDGQTLLGNGATAVFLDEFSPSGVFVRSIALPTTVSGNNKRLTVSGTSVSECQITRSADGRYIVMAGYNAAVGTLNLAASSSGTNARVIGRIDSSGNIDTTTSLSDALSGGSTRGAASTNGTDLWISGNGTGSNSSGLRYTAIGATTSTPLLGTSTNFRAVNVFGGQLYASSGSGTVRMASVGSGTPITSGQTLNALPGIPTAVSLNSFFFADLSGNVIGLDTLYAADDVGGVIRKYSFDGNTWIANGIIALSGVTGLTGSISGNAVTLYIINSSSLHVITDTSGFNAMINGPLTNIASPPDLTEFRSVVFSPVSAPTVIVNWGFRGLMRRVTVTVSNSGSGVKRIYFKPPYATDFQHVEGNSVRFKVIRAGGAWSFQAFIEDDAGNRSDVVAYTTN
jgi:hypothetical protein